MLLPYRNQLTVIQCKSKQQRSVRKKQPLLLITLLSCNSFKYVYINIILAENKYKRKQLVQSINSNFLPSTFRATLEYLSVLMMRVKAWLEFGFEQCTLAHSQSYFFVRTFVNLFSRLTLCVTVFASPFKILSKSLYKAYLRQSVQLGCPLKTEFSVNDFPHYSLDNFFTSSVSLKLTSYEKMV